MTDRQENLYRGYHIVTSSSGGTSPPYTATFRIAEARADGTIGPTDTRHCDTTYQIAQEAHAAANVAARALIDSILAKQ